MGFLACPLLLSLADFGMMGSIEPSVRQALIRATLHLVNREYELLAEDFVALGLLPRGSNMNEVIPALTGAFVWGLCCCWCGTVQQCQNVTCVVTRACGNTLAYVLYFERFV